MRDTSRPIPFVPAARAVFDVSLEAMLWTRRSLLMGLLIAMPVAFALVYRVVLAFNPRAVAVTPHDFYAMIVAVYWIRNVLPLAALFYATALISDEIEGRTLGYLVTRPLTRVSVFAGKFAAYVATTLSLALPAGVLTFFLVLSARGFSAVGPAVGDLFRDLGAEGLTLIAYGALFALLGVALKRPLIPGLLFLFGWEMLVYLPGYLPRLTLTAWLRSLVTHRPAERGLAGLLGEQVLPVVQAVPVLIVLSVIFVWAAARIFSNREYVLEQ